MILFFICLTCLILSRWYGIHQWNIKPALIRILSLSLGTLCVVICMLISVCPGGDDEADFLCLQVHAIELSK